LKTLFVSFDLLDSKETTQWFSADKIPQHRN